LQLWRTRQLTKSNVTGIIDIPGHNSRASKSIAGTKDAPWKTESAFHFRTGPATTAGCSHRRIMVAV
jgi:hypothetical protein